MFDSGVFQMVLMVLIGWLERRERETIAYLIEENRLIERNHQGLGNALIDSTPTTRIGPIGRRQRLGGVLSYYCRAA